MSQCTCLFKKVSHTGSLPSFVHDIPGRGWMHCYDGRKQTRLHILRKLTHDRESFKRRVPWPHRYTHMCLQEMKKKERREINARRKKQVYGNRHKKKTRKRKKKIHGNRHKKKKHAPPWPCASWPGPSPSPRALAPSSPGQISCVGARDGGEDSVRSPRPLDAPPPTPLRGGAVDGVLLLLLLLPDEDPLLFAASSTPVIFSQVWWGTTSFRVRPCVTESRESLLER